METNANYRQKLFDEYEQSLFRLAIFDASEREGLRVEAEEFGPEDEQPSEQQFAAFIKRIEHTGRKTDRQKRKPGLRRINKLAAGAAVLLVVFMISMVTVDALRMEVLNFLVRMESKYTLIKLGDNDTVKEWAGVQPKYVPEGYEVDDTMQNDVVNKIVYMVPADDDKIIIFMEYVKDNKLTLDTESADFIGEVTINGSAAFLSKKNAMIDISWPSNGHIYNIYGTVTTDEIIRMAESVE